MLCIIFQWWISLIIRFPKLTEYTIPAASPDVSSAFGVMTTCQHTFILGYKCAILVGDAENKGGYACVGGQGVYGKSLHLPSNFLANLKLLSSIKSLFNNNKMIILFPPPSTGQAAGVTGSEK